MSPEPPADLEVFQVDAFAERPFAGNPAAVCILDDFPADSWLQSVASEMNLSETAFLRRRPDGWDLRWFTPAAEVDLCGHATLASAHVLFDAGIDRSEELVFHTLGGRLGATRRDGSIVLDFPAEPAVAGPPAEGLLAALGVAASEVEFSGRNRVDELVVIGDPARLRALRPSMRELERIGMRGAIVSSPSDSADADFLSRYFAPAFGVPEDPVTGSAHCCLGPYWAGRLGRDRLAGHQASARGGTVGVAVRGDRVDLIGRAVTVLRGRLTAGGASR